MTKNSEKIIIILNSILTKVVYIFYPVLLIYLAVTDLTNRGSSIMLQVSQFGFVEAVSRHGLVEAVMESRFIPALFIPGISFVLVSIFRSVYNAPRPYEMPGASTPIIKKDALGKSFPSRHIFSIFIIAVTVFWVWHIPGILVGIAGVLLAICRVLGGVHFPKDVIAGAIIGIACGVIGFYVIL